MNPVEKIIGLRLESVTLSKGAFSMQFQGRKNGEPVAYNISTMYEICFHRDGLFSRDIIEDESTTELWGYLEQSLEACILVEEGRVCELVFSDASSIFVWSMEYDHDNLLVVKNLNSAEWFTIG